MYNHEPSDYRCPLCAIVQGIEGDFPYTKQADIFYQDAQVMGFIASHWWPDNPGHAIVIPKMHCENIYDLPQDLLHSIHDLSQKVAIAIKESYSCDGVTLRQHNEPAGDQDVWHYHLHVFPRYVDDRLYTTTRSLSKPEDRLLYAQRLRAFLAEKDI